MTDPFIIMCAPNGARRTKADHRNIPISPDELAACAEEILEAGASIMHLHVRDKNGKHSLSVDRYRAAIKAIRARVGQDLVLQVTTEAVGIYSRSEQMEMVRALEPEAVSIALREICPQDSDETSTADFFGWMVERKIFPQIILYNQSDMERFERMRSMGLFASPSPFVLGVLGTYASKGAENTEDQRMFYEALASSDVPWAACGFGSHEYSLATKTAESGGHVRVGFENNLLRADGVQVKNNAELVSHAAESALAVGRKIATAEDVRRQFMAH